jgi:RNA polymerase sigma factor (sigma-70 family)
MKSVVFTFGRMNPPTTGHQLLVNKLVAYAKQHSASPRVYLSHSTGKKDPLQYDTKIGFARQAFGAIVKKSNARNVIQILQSLEKEGYTHVIMFAGSDRVPEFKKLLNAYNGKEYKFEKIEVMSAGERDPDADDVSGMSASKMRALAVDNQDAAFMRGAPSTLKAQTRKQMLLAVRKALLGEDVMDYNHDDRFVEFVIENSEEDAIELPSDAEIAKMIDNMDVADLDLDDADAVMLDLLVGKEEGDSEESDKEDVKEARILSGQARQKLSQRMKSMSKRLTRLRQLKAKQMPAAQRLRMRARKAALMALRKRATGKKNLDYNSLSRSQRIAVDTALVQRFGNRLKKAVDVLSKRILPRIRSMAQKNVAKARDMKEENINELFTSNPHLLGKTKEGSPKDNAQDKIQAARRGISPAAWEKTKADAAHDSPLNVDAQKLNTLDTDPTLNDRSAPNPKQSHLNVNRKLMHYARNDEAYVHEGRKGEADARDAGDTNIIYQMRKVILSRGQHEVEFADGKKHRITANEANKLLDKYNSIRMPKEKQLFTIAAGKSLAGFKEAMLHGAPKEMGRKVSLGGKQFHEFYMGVGRTRTVAPYPQDSDEPPGTRRIAERKMKITEASSAGGVERDANDNPNKPRKTNPKLDLLLRLGLADGEELQKYRRALRTSKKQALASPEMRNKLADLLDKLIELTTGDAAIYSRARTKIVTTKEAYSLLRKSEMSGIDANIIAEVYVRGLNEHDNDSTLAFDRVNSFIAGGMASLIDGDLAEAVKSPTGGLKDACWSGYTAVGMKMKGGRKVPNCVPKEAANPAQQAAIAVAMKKAGKKPKNEETNEAFKIKSKEAETSYNTHDDMMDNVDRAKLKTVLGNIMKDMQPREQQILRARFWDNKTLAQIAKETGVTAPRIRQIEARALNKLKAPINAKKLKPFREEAMDEATKQQKAAGAALATQRGEYAGGKKGGAVNRMSLMKTKDLVKLARGKKTNEEVEQVDEISSAMLYRAKQAAQKKAGWLMPGDKGKGDKAWNRVKKFRDAGVAKEKQEKTKKVNEAFAEQTLSTHPATSLASRTKRVKSFHAWEPKDANEANRVADVRMVKVRLPDGRLVYRKVHSKAEVQHEAAHTHPTGKVPYGVMTDKELRADLTKKTKAASEAYTGSEPTSSNKNDPSNRFAGTDSIRKNYASVTPGQTQELNVASFAADKPSYDSGRNDPDSYGQRVLANAEQGKKQLKDIKKALDGIRESNDLNESFAAGFELAPFARDYGIQVQSSFTHHPKVQEALDAQEDAMNEAIYQGRDVPLNKPMKGDVKKSKVYVRDPSTGNIKKVNFGDKTLSIKKDQPARKRSYCARSGGQGNLTKKTSANYWSRRAWDC